MNSKPPQRLNIISLISARLHAGYEGATGKDLATGFVAHWNNQFFLLTNWHVVSGRKKAKQLSDNYEVWTHGYPKYLQAELHISGGIGAQGGASRYLHTIPLCDDDGQLLWTELRGPGGRADLVALRLKLPDGLKPFALAASNFDIENRLDLSPGEPVSIVGFPLGEGVDKIVAAIWKTGHLASDLALNYNPEWPSFLVDVTARPGMSGSPVYAIRYLASRAANGKFETMHDFAPSMAERFGAWITGHSPKRDVGFWFEFLGIYSGGLEDAHEQRRVELGVVWKRALVRALLEKATK